MLGSESRFKDPTSEASAHFGVALDGRIWQWVRIEDTAWANGFVNLSEYSPSWVAEADAKGVNINTLTVSIEHEGKTGQPFSEVQYQASLWLHRQIIAATGIVPSRENIIGHYQVDIVNRRFCPGSTFPFDRLVKALRGGSSMEVVTYPSWNVITNQAESLSINKPFLDWYLANGGLPVFGLPISPEIRASEIGWDKTGDGQADTVQFFEAYCLEYTKTGVVRKANIGRMGLEAFLSARKSS